LCIRFAEQVGVLRDLDAQCVLHRAHAGQRVGAGAHAADALDEGPGVARVAALQDDFEAAPHRAGGHRVADDVVAVEVHLAAHVALDARDRVDDDAAAAVVELEPLRFVSAHGCSSVFRCSVLLAGQVGLFSRGRGLVAARLMAEMAACAATAAPTTPAAVPPIWSALPSMPNWWIVVRRS
jgi:hypothetical protein